MCVPVCVLGAPNILQQTFDRQTPWPVREDLSLRETYIPTLHGGERNSFHLTRGASIKSSQLTLTYLLASFGDVSLHHHCYMDPHGGQEAM